MLLLPINMQSKQVSLNVVSLDYQKSFGFNPDIVVIHYITKMNLVLRKKQHFFLQA